MKRKKTNEGLAREIVTIIILFVTIALLTNAVVKRRAMEKTLPTLEDLHQQQEMIDYHRAQGREIILNQ